MKIERVYYVKYFSVRLTWELNVKDKARIARKAEASETK